MGRRGRVSSGMSRQSHPAVTCQKRVVDRHTCRSNPEMLPISYTPGLHAHLVDVSYTSLSHLIDGHTCRSNPGLTRHGFEPSSYAHLRHTCRPPPLYCRPPPLHLPPPSPLLPLLSLSTPGADRHSCRAPTRATARARAGGGAGRGREDEQGAYACKAEPGSRL